MDRGRGEAALALARLFQCAPCPYLASGSAVASDRWDDVTNPFCDAVKLHRAALARSSSTVEALKCCSRSCFNGTGAYIKGALRNLHCCQMEGNKAPVVLFLLVENAATTCLSVDIEPCLPFCLGRGGVGGGSCMLPRLKLFLLPAIRTHVLPLLHIGKSAVLIACKCAFSWLWLNELRKRSARPLLVVAPLETSNGSRRPVAGYIQHNLMSQTNYPSLQEVTSPMFELTCCVVVKSSCT